MEPLAQITFQTNLIISLYLQSPTFSVVHFDIKPRKSFKSNVLKTSTMKVVVPKSYDGGTRTPVLSFIVDETLDKPKNEDLRPFKLLTDLTNANSSKYEAKIRIIHGDKPKDGGIPANASLIVCWNLELLLVSNNDVRNFDKDITMINSSMCS
jgi:hypothetical protein